MFLRRVSVCDEHYAGPGNLGTDKLRVRAERDSTKDEIVVVVFIATTSALLIWAVMKPWVEKWLQVGGVIRTRLSSSYFRTNVCGLFSGRRGSKAVHPSLFRAAKHSEINHLIGSGAVRFLKLVLYIDCPGMGVLGLG